MLTKDDDNQDEELDPKRLKFGISPEERKELERKAKAKSKPAKNWRPEGH